jgi:hypothetical protein
MQIAGLNIKSSAESESPIEPIRLVLCLPGRMFSNHFIQSLINTLNYLTKQKLTFVVSMHYSSVVYFARNGCLGCDTKRGRHQKPFDGKIDFTHALWIDSDSVWDAGVHIASLLEYAHKVDVVSGIYMTANRRDFATVLLKDWDMKYYGEHGEFRFMNENDIRGKKGLLEAAYTGFGFTLMTRRAIESLEYPWFRQITLEVGDIFEITSEDVAFCTMLRERGFKIWVDPTIRIGHEKNIII